MSVKVAKPTKKVPVQSIAMKSGDYGKNVIEGSCVFCKSTITLHDLNSGIAVRLKSSNTIRSTMAHTKHHITADMVA